MLVQARCPNTLWTAMRVSGAKIPVPLGFMPPLPLAIQFEQVECNPLEKRKAKLEKILARTQRMRFVEYMDGDGPIIFKHACKLKLEGIVSKRRDSSYRSGPSKSWIKTKNPAAPAAMRIIED